MTQVYLLQHSYELPGGCEETKIIGVYASRALAEAALARAQPLPGFRDHPAGFCIDCYVLDQDHWTEGFVCML